MCFGYKTKEFGVYLTISCSILHRASGIPWNPGLTITCVSVPLAEPVVMAKAPLARAPALAEGLASPLVAGALPIEPLVLPLAWSLSFALLITPVNCAPAK